MEEEKKELLQRLKNVYDMENNQLAISGNEDKIKIDDVISLGTVTLTKEIDGEKENIQLNVYTVLEGKTVKYYSDDMLLGTETQGVGVVPSQEYLLEFEEDNPIKDVITNLKQREREDETKEKGEHQDSLSQLLEDDEMKEYKKTAGVVKKEKKAAEVKKEKGQDNNKSASDYKNNEGNKVKMRPDHVIQTVDLDKVYIDYRTTLRQALKIPSSVKELAFAYPNTEDERKLSDDLTVLMVDSNGYQIDEVDGKKITDFLQVDDATGNNPLSEDNTKINLDETVEKDKNNTLKRFRTVNYAGSYISIDQKKVGQYNDINFGGKSSDGNDSVEVQLETDNIEVQTSLEMQKIFDGRRGIYKEYNIDRESDSHKKHGDGDIEVKNADGKKETVSLCDSVITKSLEFLKEDENIKNNFSDDDLIKIISTVLQENPEISQEDLILRTKEKCSDYFGSDSDTAGGEMGNKQSKKEGRFKEGPWDSVKH